MFPLYLIMKAPRSPSLPPFPTFCDVIASIRFMISSIFRCDVAFDDVTSEESRGVSASTWGFSLFEELVRRSGSADEEGVSSSCGSDGGFSVASLSRFSVSEFFFVENKIKKVKTIFKWCLIQA